MTQNPASTEYAQLYLYEGNEQEQVIHLQAAPRTLLEEDNDLEEELGHPVCDFG